MRGRRWRAAIVTIALAGMLAAGCGRESSESGDTGAKKAGAPTSTVGFDGKTISLGIITIQTSPAAVIGLPWTNGNLAYIKEVNAKGGIAGKYKIKPIVVDSGLDTTRAVQQYNAMKNRVVMFGNVLSTVVTNAVLPQIKRDGAVAVPGSLDSTWLHEPNLAPWYTPYQIEAVNGFDWYVGANGTDKKVCSAVQDDTYGEAVQAGADFAAKANGTPLAKAVKFQPTDKDFTAPVTALRRAGCDAVVLGTTPTGTGSLLGKSAAEGFAPQWIGMITTWTPALGASKLGSYLTQHLVVVGDGPTWRDKSVPGMAESVKAMETYFPRQKPDLFFEEGYVQSRVAVQVLEKAVELGDLSHAGVLKALTALPKVSFGGLSGDYIYGPPEHRSPPRVNSIFKVVPKAPLGIEVLKENVQSEAAAKFDFSAG
jgi:ABC-type branched-subunit amino acid transport system substrate-binding protein